MNEQDDRDLREFVKRGLAPMETEPRRDIPSPIRTNASTVRTMQINGSSTSWGMYSSADWPSLTIAPHSAVGAWTPAPR